MAERGRVAGIETQAWVFEPKDGLRYGHKFWADPESGLLVKARIVDERNEVIEQFAFTEILIGVKIDREQVNPTWAVTPPDWQVRQLGQAGAESKETGWTVTRVPPGFVKIVDGFRRLKARGTWRTSFIRMGSSRSRCSSSRSAPLRIRSESPGRVASMSSSASRTTIS